MSFEIGEEIVFDKPPDVCVVVHQSRFLTVASDVSNGQDLHQAQSTGFQSDSSIRSVWKPFRYKDLPSSIVESCSSIALGVYQGERCSLLCSDLSAKLPNNVDESSSASVSCANDPIFEILPSSFEWLGLRSLLPSMNSDTFMLASRALQLYQWNKDHRFCGRCGSKTSLSPHDRAWECQSCELLCYPRIAPCVIGLVTDGPKVLLARGLKHRPELFSCLAGFIEPGESAEQAFAREVKEEVNLEISNIRYCGSQAWPFPGQLMIGFYADYAGGDLQVDGVEIVEAKWYTKDDLPEIPSTYSISGTIIRDYLQRF